MRKYAGPHGNLGKEGTRREANTKVGLNGKLQGTHQGSRATTRLLRRVAGRVLEIAFEKVLRRVLRRWLAVGFRGRKGSEKGS